MVMTYVGSLKTLLYWPIFRIFGSSPWTLRLPVVLLGAITIFVFLHLAAGIGRCPGGRDRGLPAGDRPRLPPDRHF